MTDDIRPLIAGNWKMNGLKASMAEFEAMLAGAPVDAYTALDAKDALPADQADRVRRLTRPY